MYCEEGNMFDINWGLDCKVDDLDDFISFSLMDDFLNEIYTKEMHHGTRMSKLERNNIDVAYNCNIGRNDSYSIL